MKVKKYVYSTYWRTWSRVLTFTDGCWVEVNLTPVNRSKTEWERNSKIIIRKHRTSQDDNVFADELPPGVICELEKNVKQDILYRLLNEDFLPSINWSKYNTHCNGGAEFDIIKE